MPTPPAPSPAAPVDWRARSFPAKVFADSSFWYQKLPDNTVAQTNSAAITKAIADPGPLNYATTWYTPPLVVAHNSDPLVNIKWIDCFGHSATIGDRGLVANNFVGLHIPAGVTPAPGTDAELTVYNVDSDTYTDLWASTNVNGQWSACWGGTIRNASQNNGVFTSPYGSSASGLALAGGVIRASELQAGRIDHVVGIAVPQMQADTFLAPANRTDGRNPGGFPVARMGQILRLPADLDLSTLGLKGIDLTLARAAQEYGLIIWDSGTLSVRVQSGLSLPTNPYPALFAASGQTALSNDFPIRLLEVVTPESQAQFIKP